MQSKFKKSVLAAVVVAGGALGVSAWAANAGHVGGKSGCEARHAQAAKAKWDTRRGEHLAALKEKLKLAPSQEAAWQAFVVSGERPPAEKAVRRATHERFVAMTAPQRMDAVIEKTDARRAHLAKRAEAVKAFYGQLTSEQQAVFDAAAMPKPMHGHMRRQS